MSALALERRAGCERLGLKGPGAAAWLASAGFAAPVDANTWICGRPEEAPLVARLGSSEFFLEDAPAGQSVRRLAAALCPRPPGVYPVLREDWALILSGAMVHEVLAQVCSLDFAAMALEARPLLMTSMIGVGVLIVPQRSAEERIYRVWCDPSFGPYLSETLGAVVVECGGTFTGAAA